MKNLISTIIVIVLVALATAPAVAQDLDDLVQRAGSALINSALARNERDNLGKKVAEMNRDQPGFKWQGATIEVRLADQGRGWDRESFSWLRSRVSQELTALGAVVTWNVPEILREAEDRDALSSNRWVRQGSVPAEGTIEVAQFLLELGMVQLEKESDLSVWLGSWSRGVDFRLDRETRTVGLTAQLRERSSGGIGAVYRSIGSASTADNVGGEISQLFGSRMGFQGREEDSDGRSFRALEGAIWGLGKVMRSKSGPTARGR